MTRRRSVRDRSVRIPVAEALGLYLAGHTLDEVAAVVDRPVAQVRDWLATAWDQHDGDLAAARAVIETACPGPCNDAWHLGTEDEVVPGTPVWCWPCAERVVSTLGKVPDLAAQVRVLPGGRLRLGSDVNERRSSGVVRSLSSPALDLVDEVTAWLGDEVNMLAQRVGHATRAPRPTPERLRWMTTGVRYLVGHSTAWLCTPWADESGLQVVRFEAQMTRALGEDRLEHQLPAPCPQCNTKALVRHDGESRVECRTCKADWDEAYYEHLVRVLTDDQAAGR